MAYQLAINSHHHDYWFAENFKNSNETRKTNSLVAIHDLVTFTSCQTDQRIDSSRLTQISLTWWHTILQLHCTHIVQTEISRRLNHKRPLQHTQVIWTKALVTASLTHLVHLDYTEELQCSRMTQSVPQGNAKDVTRKINGHIVHILNVNINGRTPTTMTNSKMLGITIDQMLTFKSQTTNTQHKL